jgi:hypothetical protein
MAEVTLREVELPLLSLQLCGWPAWDGMSALAVVHGLARVVESASSLQLWG